MEKYKSSKFIFVVGIGGSDLASKAVWNAMTLHKQDIDKKILFLESPDSREYEEVRNIVRDEIESTEEIALITVSKSGKTVETLETFRKTLNILSSKFGDSVNERGIIVSTLDSTLWKLAKEKGMDCLEWEGNIGGRFSAFTIAHTAILSVAGLDAKSFIAGSKEEKKEEAGHLAKNIFENYKKGFNILDFFIFNSELEDLGKWCRQLIAESLSLITPTVSLGPTDLHSMLELYLGGPKNRFTIFIKSLQEIENSLNDSAYENVSKAYKDAELPFIKYEMEKINEKELGIFMAFMIETTLELAKLLQINPYDQPAVEEYKKHLAKDN
jgi:glucose-6-phosphate isomerase